MKLFVSFTTLLGAIVRSEVTQEDLDTGLYFLGCVRSHAFEPGAEGETNERLWVRSGGVAAHATLIAALERAATEGRCRWYRPEVLTRLPKYSTLNELLVANGLEAVAQKDPFGDYCYPTVRDYLDEKTGFKPEVVF